MKCVFEALKRPSGGRLTYRFIGRRVTDLLPCMTNLYIIIIIICTLFIPRKHGRLTDYSLSFSFLIFSRASIKIAAAGASLYHYIILHAKIIPQCIFIYIIPPSRWFGMGRRRFLSFLLSLRETGLLLPLIIAALNAADEGKFILFVCVLFAISRLDVGVYTRIYVHSISTTLPVPTFKSSINHFGFKRITLNSACLLRYLTFFVNMVGDMYMIVHLKFKTAEFQPTCLF
jgi:hypothetical protein